MTREDLEQRKLLVTQEGRWNKGRIFVSLIFYNEKFLDTANSQESIFNDAEKYGVSVKTLQDIHPDAESGKYWKVIGVHHLTGQENGGNHHVFCDVLDENGVRIYGTRLALSQINSPVVWAVIDKPQNEPGTNFPMWLSTNGTVYVDGDLISESVTGLTSRHPDEDFGNTFGHHSFYIVFQKTDVAEQNDETNSLEDVVSLVGQPLIIPLNQDAAFYKFGKNHNLGERLSKEYDVKYQNRNYRAQIFEKGIVYAEVGDWGNVKVIQRVN